MPAKCCPRKRPRSGIGGCCSRCDASPPPIFCEIFSPA
jgi:hypothetical protein